MYAIKNNFVLLVLSIKGILKFNDVLSFYIHLYSILLIKSLIKMVF